MFGLSYDEERLLHEKIAYVMIYVSLPVFLTLYYVLPAPWGKTLAIDSKPWWLGPLLPARISWFVFESPNLVWALICWKQRRQVDMNLASQILLSLFVLHYIRRAIVYPLTMSPKTKPMPAAIVLSAVSYCAFNG